MHKSDCIFAVLLLRPSRAAPKRSTKEASKKETDIAKKAEKKDTIPLFAGSNVFVSKTDLAAAYIPNPPIYTSRVADLVIGKAELKRIAFGNAESDQSIFQAIITHVCQVFAMHGVMQSIKALFEDKNTSTNIQYTTTQRGRIMLIYNGYRYVVNRQSLKNVFWRCSRYVKHCCRATLVTSKVNDVTLRIAGSPHTHGPEVKPEECSSPDFSVEILDDLTDLQ
ncbi:hypothetical protein ACLKA7_011107 [Drosophila subpalustris]